MGPGHWITAAAAGLPLAWGAMLWLWSTGAIGTAVGSHGALLAPRVESRTASPSVGARWWRLPAAAELRLDGLVTADGRPLPAGALAGRWTVVAVGFTTCSQVCPLQLRLLAEAFGLPAWRDVAGADARAAFLSIDPMNDTPQRLSTYLAAFPLAITGLTGPPVAIDRAVRALGAGFERRPDGFDHSNSLFVIGPDARVAGVLLRPSSPTLLVDDFTALKRAWLADRPRDGAPGW